jgi:predicted CoA-binding protein
MSVFIPEGAPASADPIGEILKTTRTIAVVGLSSKRWRASFGVAQYLQAAGYRIIPVNPQEREVLGQKAYATLEEVPDKVEMVDIFRRSEAVAPVVESAIRMGTKTVWMQEGVIDLRAAERARQAGLHVIVDLCVAKELHKRNR